jgi:hypothetical protein
MVESFWPTPSTETKRTPHAVIMEQANALSQQTNGLLVGDVKRTQQNERFISTLSIKAPALNNYTYTVLSINHAITLYPLLLYFSPTSTNTEVLDETALLADLKKLLASDPIKRVMDGLLTQIRAYQEVSG